MYKTADEILSLSSNVLLPEVIRHIDCFYGRIKYRAGKPRPGEKEGWSLIKYDLDTVVDCSGNRPAKYDERTKKLGTDQVIPLQITDMDFKTTQPIVDALTIRVQEGIWGYANRPDSYFEVIRGRQRRRNGWDTDPNLMSFSLGMAQSISAIAKLLALEGGSVLIQTPVCSEFYDMIEAWSRKVLEDPSVGKDGRWEMDWADFETKLVEADLFLLCSPHNPLGTVWTPEELHRIVGPYIKHRVVLFSDGIHSDLIFHDRHHTPTVSVFDEAARYVVAGISGIETLSLAGPQTSTVVFPNIHTEQVFGQLWVNMDIYRDGAFSLTAMEAAFNHGEGWLEQLLPYLSVNSDSVADYCRKHILQIKTCALDTTYLMWLDYRALGLDNDALCRLMIEQTGLGLDDGCSFGRNLNGYMYLNTACPRSTLGRTMKQFEAAVKALWAHTGLAKGGKFPMANLQKKSFWQQYGNLVLILSGILIGVLTGAAAPDFGTTIKPIDDIFFNLLFTIAVPLVLVPTTSAVGSIADMKCLGKILGGTIGTFVFTGAVAGVCVPVWVNLLSLSADITIELVASEVSEAQTADELLVSFLTVSDFSDLWDRSNTLPLIVFAILFGFCVFICGDEQSPAGRLLVNLDDIIMKFVGTIMLMAPIGLGAYFANPVVTYGPEIIGDYGRFVLVHYPLCTPYGVVFFSLYASLAGSRRSVAVIVKSIPRPAVTVFATQSSAATTPVNKKAYDNIDVPKNVSDLVLPVGCTMHMDDSVLSSITKIAFLYGVFSMNFSGADTYSMVIVMTILFAFVLSGASGGSLMGKTLIVSTFNFPAEVFPITTTLGLLFDPTAICLNVSGSTIASVLVTRPVEGKERPDKATVAKRSRV